MHIFFGIIRDSGLKRSGTMKEVAFDNDKYLKLQSKHILERISNFDNKLYLEFGGKLFDDHHAARVPCLEVSTMKLSDEFNLPIDESPYFSGLFFFEII